MNYDWHDDMLCSSGLRQQRPYLLPNDPYITEEEIVRAAAQYEAWLNSGR